MAAAGFTLPGRDYHSAEVFELERERVFFRQWFYAGRVDSLAEAGSFVAVDVVGESVLVVRGKDGELRGFYNVCRHRGSRLCDEESSGKLRGAIKCPYHAWSYSFDGKLIGTPLMAEDEIDRKQFGLWPVTGGGLGKGSCSCTSAGRHNGGLRESLLAQGRARRSSTERFGFAGGCGAPARRSARWRPTGRSWSRTTTSACTARRCTPS